MASLAKNFSLIFLLTLLSSFQINARNYQFFNKIPSHNNAVRKTSQVEQQPDFIPEDDNNGYGLYGHESGQLRPSTATTTNVEEPATTALATNNVEELDKIPTTTPTDDLPNSKYLPKNYNPVSYVTVPENFDNNNNNNNEEYHRGDSTQNNNNPDKTPTTTPTDNSKYLPKNYNPVSYVTVPENFDNTNNNNDKYNNNNKEYYNSGSKNNNGEYYNGATTYNNNNEEYYTVANNNNNDEYYNSASTYNNEEYYNDASTYSNNNNEEYNNNGGSNKNDVNNYYQEKSNPTNNYNNRVQQQQGLSDTRFLENGKYFYDVNTEKYAYDNSRSSNNDQFNNTQEELELDDEEMP